MADVRLAGLSGKPTVVKKVGQSLLLMISATLVGILLVELLCKIFLPSTGVAQDLYRGIYRVAFFDGRDSIFRNEGSIFTFTHHNVIRNVSGSFSKGPFSIEYDYYFRTNNFGLVQDSDVVPERESILLLGDSFTEGQGAEPWFRLVIPEIEKLGYQAINGGILGTGFEQWLKLERYLTSKNVRIRKLVVLFISDDYNRPVWNFRPNDLQCLTALLSCRFGETLLYRLPPQEELSSWIDKIKTARAPMERKLMLDARAEALLPASYQVFNYFNERLRRPDSLARSDRAEEQSRAAIAELIRLYGSENVLFMHLPKRQEIGKKPTSLGLRARHSIEDAGGKLFDGFNRCRLTGSDYYLDDEHPNSSGYAKIASCVNAAIQEVTPVAQ